MKYKVSEGDYEKNGVQLKDGTVIFTFAGEKEDSCNILFYDKEQVLKQKVHAPKEFCRGSIRSVLVSGIDARHLRYNYEINGEIRQDVYAQRIIGREKWNDDGRRKKDYALCCGCVEQTFDWKMDRQPEIPGSRMILYQLHVRNFSMDAGLRGHEKGTFAAIKNKIGYLKNLGITTLELMPVYEFEEIEFREMTPPPAYVKWEKQKDDLIVPGGGREAVRVNCWGYVPGNYFAVKASYSSIPDASVEYKELIRSLHLSGMECVMQMFFDERMNQNVILDALRFWVREYHVDGFHLFGSSVPVTAIVQDPLLSRTKIFYDGFAPMLLESKTRYRHLFVANDEYLYPVRKLLNHTDGRMEEFLCQQRKQHSVQGFINYVANNNGFTLADLFCYCEKHNEQNGEDNRDGNNWNYSGNCGVEGKTRKQYVQKMRHRQMKNAFAALFLAQGVPLIYEGDEFGNSQDGNNNAYCQDNATGWINWKTAVHYKWLTDFVKNMIKFRQMHPVVCQEEPMKFNDYGRKGFPDISYHGENAWLSSVSLDRQAVGVLYCGAYAKREDKTEDDFIYVGYNFHSGRAALALPKLPEGRKWYAVMNTAEEISFAAQSCCLEEQHMLSMTGQSVCILKGILEPGDKE